MDIDNMVGGIYKMYPNLKNSKFGYAYKRFAEKSIYPEVKEYSDNLADIRIEHAMEDEKTKEVKTDPESNRGFKYTKDGLRSVMKAERAQEKTWNVKEFEVTAFKVASTPEELNEEEIEMLKGILF